MLFLAATRSPVFCVSIPLGRASANVDLYHLPSSPFGGGDQSGGFRTELSAALARLAVWVFAFLSVAVDHRHLPVCMQVAGCVAIEKIIRFGTKKALFYGGGTCEEFSQLRAGLEGGAG
ncbi:unnamed protein product, partial [Ectocarpus sp. 12 AP-2014]